MRLIIVDDHPLVRKGLLGIFDQEEDFEVTGEASSIEQALNLIRQEKPDFALIDLKLGDENGLEIVRCIYREKPSCKFIILTSMIDDKTFKEAEALKVEGYILKGAFPEEILYAIRLISKGRKYYDPGMLDMIMDKNHHKSFEVLTAREMEILNSIARGLSNKQIAKEYYITEFTVKKHVSQILSKLNLSDRTQAAIYAYNKGFLKNVD